MLLRHPSARFVDACALAPLSPAQVTTGSHTIDPTRIYMITWLRGGAAHAMGQTDLASWLVSVASWYAQLEQARDAGYYLSLAEKAFRALAVRQTQGGVRNDKMGHRCYDGRYCYWFHSCPVCNTLADTVVLNQHLHAVRDALESHVTLARWRDGELPLVRDPSQAAPLPAVLSPTFIDELREHGRGGLFQLAFAAGNQVDAAAPPNLRELQLDAGTVGGRSHLLAAYRFRLGQGPAGIAAGNTCSYHYHSMDLLAGILHLIAGDQRFAKDPYFVEIYYGLLYGRIRGDTRSCSNRSNIPPSRRMMAGVPLAELYLGGVVDLTFQDDCDGIGRDRNNNSAVWRNGAVDSPVPHGPRVFFDKAYIGCSF